MLRELSYASKQCYITLAWSYVNFKIQMYTFNFPSHFQKSLSFKNIKLLLLPESENVEIFCLLFFFFLSDKFDINSVWDIKLMTSNKILLLLSYERLWTTRQLAHLKVSYVLREKKNCNHAKIIFNCSSWQLVYR